MTKALSATEAPTLKWSVDGFARFWREPNDINIISHVVMPDIKGYWPFRSEPVTGRQAYVDALAEFIAVVPGLTIKVTDHATNGNVNFLRWQATGKPLTGPDTIIGIDRLIVQDGYVSENHICSDHPLFALLAEKNGV